jgi:hypothetical protein
MTKLANRGPRLLLGAVIAAPLMFVPAVAATAATISVCPSGCQFSQLAPAIEAAKSGDMITIAAGTYTGGVTIDKNVSVLGAGAGATVIKGGGPVFTIGAYGATNEPTVSISGVTITDGVARSSPESVPFRGEEGVIARGGGVEIPPNADFSGGATVSIADSVITGNRAAPTDAPPLGPPCPGGVRCPFAMAAGGGIDSWGSLTLASTTVSDNRVGSASGLSTVASDADGGGITSELGRLTINHSRISDNQATATAPNGRFADSGGIFAEGGSLAIEDSKVTGNTARLAAALPNSVDLLAIAGGIHITGDVSSATITGTRIGRNTVEMTNTVGDSNAFSGGVHTDGTFTLTRDVIDDNQVYAATLPGSTGNAAGDSGAGEWAGAITGTQVAGNTVTIRSAAGSASAAAGASIVTGSVSSSAIDGNHVLASSPNGTATVMGGGVVTGGALTLHNTSVSRNTGDAHAPSGTAQGGGIFAVDQSPNGPPGGPLLLTDSLISGNQLIGSAPITLRGGGLYVTNPLTLTHTLITGNSPDNCAGSSC